MDTWWKTTGSPKLEMQPFLRQSMEEIQSVSAVVRNMSMAITLPLATPTNPFALEPNTKGLILVLKVVELDGNDRDTRLASCAMFCEERIDTYRHLTR